MSHIKIERRHTLGAAVAKGRVAEIEPMLRDRFGIRIEWNGTNATFKGRGVSGSARITDDQLKIELELGLIVRPFAGKIRRVMEKNIDEALGRTL
ncbi:MAG: polyhydroxyalkanoic acid system family protein [Myxococcota bacterium]